MKLYVRGGRARLRCPQGHLEVEFVWQAGSAHADHHQAELACGECGKQAVHHAGDDPWAAEFVEVEVA